MIEQLHAGQCLRHEYRGQKPFRQGQGLVLHDALQQRLCRDQAEHIVESASAHRIARMLFIGNHAQHFVGAGIGVEPNDFGARDHHRSDLPIVEPEHIAHHLVLVRFDHTGVQAFDQAGGDLFFRHAAVRRLVHAQQAQAGFGAHRQQPHERSRNRRQPLHRARHQPGHGFRMDLANALGHQLAEDDGEESDHDHDHCGRGDVRRAVVHAEGQVQPARERRRKGSVTNNAVEHADRRDADLHGGKKFGRVVVQVHRCLRTRIVGLHHHLQPRLAARRQGHFRHRENGIQQYQEDQKGNFHAVGAVLRAGQRSRIGT